MGKLDLTAYNFGGFTSTKQQVYAIRRLFQRMNTIYALV